jgi:hypothetical protein
MGADEATAPLCPSVAPSESFTGHGNLIVPEVCTTCVCEPPSGSCELPATLTASSAICPGDGSGVTHTSFDPPASWGGTCTATNAIPAGKLCGGVPCVQSVTIAPLTMKQGACTLIETPHVPAPPTWGMFARACIAAQPPLPQCTAQEAVCSPASPGPEFKQCVSLLYPNPDEVKCSPDYPNRSVIYQDFVDQRTCAPCSCDAPDGGTCTGSISVFKDSTCKAPLFATLEINATDAPCVDVPPGSSIGSASASERSYMPGKCPVIGGTLGKISFTLPRIICCQGTP